MPCLRDGMKESNAVTRRFVVRSIDGSDENNNKKGSQRKINDWVALTATAIPLKLITMVCCSITNEQLPRCPRVKSGAAHG